MNDYKRHELLEKRGPNLCSHLAPEHVPSFVVIDLNPVPFHFYLIKFFSLNKNRNEI